MSGGTAMTLNGLLDLVKKEWTEFSETDLPLTNEQQDRIKKCSGLVGMNRNALKKNARKLRARTILREIWKHSAEVFLLCALATHPTALGSLNSEGYLKALLGWWKSVDHPKGLTETIKQYPASFPNASSHPYHLTLPVESEYFSFSITGRHMVENLPEPLKTGIKTSNLWREEVDSGGLAVTNCLSLSLPANVHEDALFQVRISHKEGFHLSNLLGFGTPVAPSFEGRAEDAKD